MFCQSRGTDRHHRTAGSGRFRHRLGAVGMCAPSDFGVDGRCRGNKTPLFGDRGRDGCAVRLALLLIEKPAAAHSHPLLLAQMLPELWEHARDAVRARFPQDVAVTDDLVLPAIRELVRESVELCGQRCDSWRRVDLYLRAFRCERRGRKVVPRKDDGLRSVLSLHGLTELRSGGVSATCHGVDGDREGPRIGGSIELPSVALEGVPGWENDLPLCQVQLLDPVHTGVHGAAIRRMLCQREVLEGDAEILPPEVATRVHEIAQKEARCAAGGRTSGGGPAPASVGGNPPERRRGSERP